MTKLYRGRWVLPVSAAVIPDGAVVVEGDRISAVGPYADLASRFADAATEDFGEAAIIPGLINTHTHLELTVMRGFLEQEESDFFAWLRKLTIARLEQLTEDDLYVSASLGISEAARAGITCVGDASNSALQSLKAVSDAGLRGIIYQESFGPDPKLVAENFALLQNNISELRAIETPLVRAGVSPHAPYTVCGPQLEKISSFAIALELPLMMHVAESAFEEMLMQEGSGPFAENYRKRGIEWTTPRMSSVQYVARHGILETQPLLTHCIRVDDADLETIRLADAGIAHCPKSNAKLGHGRAPFAEFLQKGIAVGFGSDSMASNNVCDILAEGRFATLAARSEGAHTPAAETALQSATINGARAMGLANVGFLEAGAQADFAVVGLDAAHQQPSFDPYATLIFSSSGRDVKATVVAGREVFRDGHVTTVDEERVAARVREISEKLKRVR